MLSWLALAPARAAPAPGERIVQAGPFTLQTLRLRGRLQFNANVGLVRPSYVEYQVLRDGQTVAVTDASGRRSTFQHGWVLPRAVQAALLVGGSEGWWLLTEREGRVQTDLLEQGGDGVLEWADIVRPTVLAGGGLRIDEVEPMSLEAGRLLLVNRRVLLDTHTLSRVTLPQEMPAGYQPVSTGLLGLSPDRRALARIYVGASLSWRDALITVTELATGKTRLLPMDLQAQMVPQRADLSPREQLLPHLRWQNSGSSVQGLELRPPEHADTPWSAEFLLGLRAPRLANGDAVPRFVLGPVRPSMLTAAQTELVRALGYEALPPQAGDAPDKVVHLGGSFVPLRLQLDGAHATLHIEAERAPSALWAQQAVVQSGELLLARLRAGALREHLAAPCTTPDSCRHGD